ncbi:helix-turn-helix domain-containing protein [bacterium]|nr:helix-turn-helix domain-containing protein [bacterium]
MMTIHEVAERLRVAISTVYALVESGKLGAFRIGPNEGAIRVSEQQLETYLESCRSLPQSDPAGILAE